MKTKLKDKHELHSEAAFEVVKFAELHGAEVEVYSIIAGELEIGEFIVVVQDAMGDLVFVNTIKGISKILTFRGESEEAEILAEAEALLITEDRAEDYP